MHINITKTLTPTLEHRYGAHETTIDTARSWRDMWEGTHELWIASKLESSDIIRDREAIAMGLFLQKTNIIRDGKILPRVERFGRDLESLRLGSLQTQVEDKCGKCVNHMVADALLLLPACLRYLNSLKTDSIFRFCAIPQLMAIATIVMQTQQARVSRCVEDSQDKGSVSHCRHCEFKKRRRSTSSLKLVRFFIDLVRSSPHEMVR